jgi:stage II sporulation protein P
MKKDRLYLSLLVIVILVFAVSFFYYYRGLRSDLDTIIAGNNLNIKGTEPIAGQTGTQTPTMEVYHTSTPGQGQKAFFTSTPVQVTAQSTAVTPVPKASEAFNENNNVVIYNTHPFEKLETGIEVTEYSKALSNKLNDLGALCIFLNNSNRLITDSYKKSRDLVTNNIKDYAGNILIDVHANDDIHVSNKDISIWIGKGNKGFDNNKKNADKLLEKIKEIEPGMACEAVLKDNFIWNQDLSEKAMMLIIGNKITSEERAHRIIDVLAMAIKNMKE